MSRKVKQIAFMKETLFAVCEDGTIWSRSPETTEWSAIECPPEGDAFRQEITEEEAVAKLRETGRGMIIGKGVGKK